MLGLKLRVIFSHLKLCVAVARHNFKLLKILIGFFLRFEG